MLDDERAHTSGDAQTEQVRIKYDEVISAMRTSAEFFVDFFLHEVIVFPVPEFHKKIWGMMTNVSLFYIAIAVPRGHAKTTLAKLAVVWYFLFTDYTFIVYVSNTSDVAIDAVRDIIAFIRSENFRKVFGAPIFTREREGEGEFHFVITVQGRTKKCILKARGAIQQVRGLNINNQRPQLAVVDDLEDAENNDSKVLQGKLIKWFYGTFLKALDKRGHKIIFIGNMTNTGCLLAKLVVSPRWVSMVLGAILANGQSLWPDMWTLPELVEDYKEYARMGLTSVWFAEMMNFITSGENALIQVDEILYLDSASPDVMMGGFITIDPATGQGNDETAIVAHVLTGMDEMNMMPQVIDYRYGQLDERATVDATLELAFQHGISIIVIEAVAYQRALATLFEVILATKGITGFTIIRGMYGNASKLERIRSWVALLKAHAYALTIGEMNITTQLIGFDPLKLNNVDDLIDSCAQGPAVIAEYRSLILAKRLGKVLTSKVVREGEYC